MADETKSFSSSPCFVFTELRHPISYIGAFEYKDGIGDTAKTSPKFFGARLAAVLTSAKMRETVKQYSTRFPRLNGKILVHFRCIVEETYRPH